MLFTKASIKQQEGKIIGIASSSVEDRQGEVVSVEGWDLKNFKAAPRLLWAHDHTEPAIGKVTKIYYDGAGKTKQLRFEAIFQDVTEKARAIKQLVQDGFINTFSVGFKPLEMDGNTITKQELLEISVVNVPANPQAMMLAVKSLEDAGIDKTVADELFQEDEVNPYEVQIKELKEELSKVKELADSAVKGLQYLNPQRSKQEVVSKRLQSVKILAKTADKLIVESKSPRTVSNAKLMKRTSEKLIREFKGDL